MYKQGENRQSVQEKGLWCTNRGKIGSSYRRRASGVQTRRESAIRTGEGPVVYEPAGGKEREGGRMAGREAGR